MGTGLSRPPDRFAAPAGIRVRLPIPHRNWYELALAPDRRPAAVAAQWAELRATAPDLDRPEVAAAFTATLTGLAARYARGGSQLAAVEWYPATGHPPQAVLDVKAVEPVEAVPARDEAEGLQGLLMLPAADDIGPRTVDLVELPAGTAVRLRLLAPAGGSRNRAAVADIVQFWLPVPAAPATVLVTCCTSDISAGDRNAELLDLLMTELTVDPAPAGHLLSDVDRTGACGRA